MLYDFKSEMSLEVGIRSENF